MQDNRNALQERLTVLETRIRELESQFSEASGPASAQIQGNPGPRSAKDTGEPAFEDRIKRLKSELGARGIEEAHFVHVPVDYYDKTLEHRRSCLKAASQHHLCKSIVMENTKAPPNFGNFGLPQESRYCCVIVQYAARLHADKLKRFLHKLNGKLGIKNFNMRLAPPDVSQDLTGYTHNAVTPIGMKQPLPIILSDQIPLLQPDFFWLGAGETNLKVGMSAKDFIAAFKPLIVDCTYADTPPANTNCLST